MSHPAPGRMHLQARIFRCPGSNPEVEAHAGTPPSPGSFLHLPSPSAKADGFPGAGPFSSCPRHQDPAFPTLAPSQSPVPMLQTQEQEVLAWCGLEAPAASHGSGQDGLKQHPLCKRHRRNTRSGGGSVASLFCSLHCEGFH